MLSITDIPSGDLTPLRVASLPLAERRALIQETVQVLDKIDGWFVEDLDERVTQLIKTLSRNARWSDEKQARLSLGLHLLYIVALADVERVFHSPRLIGAHCGIISDHITPIQALDGLEASEAVRFKLQTPCWLAPLCTEAVSKSATRQFFEGVEHVCQLIVNDCTTNAVDFPMVCVCWREYVTTLYKLIRRQRHKEFALLEKELRVDLTRASNDIVHMWNRCLTELCLPRMRQHQWRYSRKAYDTSVACAANGVCQLLTGFFSHPEFSELHPKLFDALVFLAHACDAKDMIESVVPLADIGSVGDDGTYVWWPQIMSHDGKSVVCSRIVCASRT